MVALRNGYKSLTLGVEEAKDDPSSSVTNDVVLFAKDDLNWQFDGVIDVVAFPQSSFIQIFEVTGYLYACHHSSERDDLPLERVSLVKHCMESVL